MNTLYITWALSKKQDYHFEPKSVTVKIYLIKYYDVDKPQGFLSLEIVPPTQNS